jgi:class 3 adenylate cyclase
VSSDLVKLFFSYLIALVLIVGGGLMLYSIRLDPSDSGSATLSLAIVGFIGSAVTFVFSAEVATRATRAAQSSAASGAAQALIDPNAEVGG